MAAIRGSYREPVNMLLAADLVPDSNQAFPSVARQ